MEQNTTRQGIGEMAMSRQVRDLQRAREDIHTLVNQKWVAAVRQPRLSWKRHNRNDHRKSMLAVNQK